MRSIYVLIGLAALLLAGNSFGQDSLQTRQKNQQRYKNKIQSEFKIQNKGQYKNQFQDENGDGLNDNAPDHDGDGIPNGKDEDYTGSKMRNGNSARGFVDEDGDGINDNAMDADGDGIPNGQDDDYTRPMDGSGYKNKNGSNKSIRTQNGAMGSGECDGTGPKGKTGNKSN